MESALAWLGGMPPAALYATLALVAAVENIVPPIPADSVVAVGSFLAARGQATLLGAALSTWAGNVAGAMGVYAVARRYGAAWAHRWAHRYGGASAADRLARLHGRYGTLAIFLSRFLPAARAIVPPFAGALRLPAVPVMLAIAVASAIWYGLIAYVAYGVGSNFDALNERVVSLGRGAAVLAGGVVLLALLSWALWRRRRA